MMTLDQARELIGAPVAYYPPGVDTLPERGVIVATGEKWAYVKFGLSPHGKATDPALLTLITSPARPAPRPSAAPEARQGYGITWHVYLDDPCIPGVLPSACPGCRQALEDGALAPDLAGITWHVYLDAPCIPGVLPSACPGCRQALEDGALAPDLANVLPLPATAQLSRDGRASLGRLSQAARLAEQVNPGRVVHVAIVTDIDGAACEIGADYNTIKIGPYRFSRDRMPEFWAAAGEAAWLAGTIEQEMRQDDETSR